MGRVFMGETIINMALNSVRGTILSQQYVLPERAENRHVGVLYNINSDAEIALVRVVTGDVTGIESSERSNTHGHTSLFSLTTGPIRPGPGVRVHGRVINQGSGTITNSQVQFIAP